MEELISIVIVAYKSEATILDTLESIKRQSYKNWEIVLADDCSPDDTVKVFKEWVNSNNLNSRAVLAVAEKNSGVSANCNMGVKAARGKFIKIIAGDDYLADNAIERFYFSQNSAKNEKIICQSKVTVVDEFNKTRQPNAYIQNNSQLLTDKKLNQYKLLLKRNFLLAPAMGLIRKDIFEEVGFFNEEIPFMEDYPFYLKLAKYGYRFALIDEPLVFYRIHSKSLTGGVSSIYEASTIKLFFKIRFKEQLKHGMLFTALKQFIRFTAKWLRLKLVRERISAK